MLILIILVAGGRIKHNDNDWKFQKYKGTNLDYDMLSESVNTYQEEKEGDVLKGNLIINLKSLSTNIEKKIVQRMCKGEGYTDKIRRGKRAGKLHCLC